MFDKNQDIGGSGTVVGANVKLNGVLKDMNDITIHGTIDGEVISDKNVLISETASVKGPMGAQMITVSGKVNGTITANKKLEITPTGKVYGSIATKDLVIRSGAVFVGKSTMIGHEKDEKSKTKQSKEKTKTESENSKGEEKETEKKSGGFWITNKQDDKQEKEESKQKSQYELEK